MSTEIVLYTHPMSRGRLARWMLEKTGVPYETVVLDYGTTMKAPAYLGDQADGQGAGVAPRRHGGHRERGDLRLSGRAGAGAATGAAAGVAGTCRLLSLAVLPGRPAGVAVDRQAGRGVGAGAQCRLRQRGRSAAHAGAGGRWPRASGRRRFSAADLYAAAVLGFYLRIGLLEPRPPFVAFAQRHGGRPALLRANAVDDALVAAHPNPDMPPSVSAPA
nr:glutathione S-transferase [Xanthomonas theicola]